jgi:hypothetical protein
MLTYRFLYEQFARLTIGKIRPTEILMRPAAYAWYLEQVRAHPTLQQGSLQFQGAVVRPLPHVDGADPWAVVFVGGAYSCTSKKEA